MRFPAFTFPGWMPLDGTLAPPPSRGVKTAVAAAPASQVEPPARLLPCPEDGPALQFREGPRWYGARIRPLLGHGVLPATETEPEGGLKIRACGGHDGSSPSKSHERLRPIQSTNPEIRFHTRARATGVRSDVTETQNKTLITFAAFPTVLRRRATHPPRVDPPGPPVLAVRRSPAKNAGGSLHRFFGGRMRAEP
jgi:hypothetical protein